MNDPPNQLLLELQNLHAQNLLSDVALEELHMVVSAAIGEPPYDFSHLDPKIAYELGLAHGYWRHIREWLESIGE